MAGFLKAAAAAIMIGVASIVPPLAGQRSLIVEQRAAPEYDGLGRKKRRVEATPVSRKRRTRDWRAYAERVVATHSFNVDPRDDKYLHSAARWGRSLRAALSGAGR